MQVVRAVAYSSVAGGGVGDTEGCRREEMESDKGFDFQFQVGFFFFSSNGKC